jgi:hypothetical protein
MKPESPRGYVARLTNGFKILLRWIQENREMENEFI